MCVFVLVVEHRTSSILSTWYLEGSWDHFMTLFGRRGGDTRLETLYFGLYGRSRTLDPIAGDKSDRFSVHVGLWQGSSLSPVLFFVEMESPLPRVEEFEYPGILLVRECWMKRGTDRQISEDWQSS